MPSGRLSDALAEVGENSLPLFCYRLSRLLTHPVLVQVSVSVCVRRVKAQLFAFGLRRMTADGGVELSVSFNDRDTMRLSPVAIHLFPLDACLASPSLILSSILSLPPTYCCSHCRL